MGNGEGGERGEGEAAHATRAPARQRPLVIRPRGGTSASPRLRDRPEGRLQGEGGEGRWTARRHGEAAARGTATQRFREGLAAENPFTARPARPWLSVAPGEARRSPSRHPPTGHGTGTASAPSPAPRRSRHSTTKMAPSAASPSTLCGEAALRLRQPRPFALQLSAPACFRPGSRRCATAAATCARAPEGVVGVWNRLFRNLALSLRLRSRAGPVNARAGRIQGAALRLLRRRRRAVA